MGSLKNYPFYYLTTPCAGVYYINNLMNKNNSSKTERNEALIKDYLENVVQGKKSVSQSIQYISQTFNETPISNSRYYEILRLNKIT